MQYAPLYILSFRVTVSKKLSEAFSLNQLYRCYEDINSIPDRLRWRRHELGLLQKEVATKIGVTRAAYKVYKEERGSSCSVMEGRPNHSGLPTSTAK